MFQSNLIFNHALALGSGFDLNSIGSSGCYDVDSPVNGPSTNSLFVLHMVAASESAVRDNMLQIAWDQLTGAEWTRAYDNNNIWGPWVPRMAQPNRAFGQLVGANAATALTAQGVVALTASGTGTARSIATTNKLTKQARVAYTQANADSKTSGARQTTPHLLGSEGWYAAFIFGFGLLGTTPRAFVGVGSAAAFITADGAVTEPSAGVNTFGVGWDAAAATNLFLINNDASGSATPVDLGSSFALATSTLFMLEIWCPAPGTSFIYRLTNLNTGVIKIGTVTTNIPVATTALGMQAYINSGESSAAAVAIDIARMACESAI